MTDTPITFGDNVRVLTTPETEHAGLAGLTAQVCGHTTPSITNVDVIGELNDDFALSVHFDERDESYWFVPELLEFVDHGAGTEITLEGVPKKWTRNPDGTWDESSTGEPSCQKHGIWSWLFGRRHKSD